MPHISDLSQGVIWQGNNGERWVVSKGAQDEKSISVELVPVPLIEELIIKEE